MAKNPTPQAISRLLKQAGFERSAVLSQSNRHPRRSAGFRVREGVPGTVYVDWVSATSLLFRSAAQAECDLATEREMVPKYAEAIKAAGWPAEVIHLSGPLVRVSPREV